MDTGFPELSELRVEVPDQTRDEQWRAIAEAITGVPAEPQISRRRRVAVWVAAAFSVGLPASAVAAEGAVPGDVLYPVKLVVEPVRSLFDPDVVAVHRVEELERIVEADAPVSDIDRAFDRADRAADEAGSPELVQRVERVREQIQIRQEDGPPISDDAPGATDSPTETSRTPSDVDQSSSTTAAGDDRSGADGGGSAGSGSTTTTAARSGSTSTSTHGDRSGDGRSSDGG